MFFGQLGQLADFLRVYKEFAIVKPIHFVAYRLPGFPGLILGNAHQYQGYKADKNMTSDTLIFAVIIGVEIKRRLKRSKGRLHLVKLFVSQNNIFEAEGIIAALH